MVLAIDQASQVSSAAVNGCVGGSCRCCPVSGWGLGVSCWWWSALMAALPWVAGWLGAPTQGGPSASALALAVGEALMGAGGHRAGAGLLGLVGEPALAGLHAGLDGPAGDRGRALLGELLVLLEAGAGAALMGRQPLVEVIGPAGVVASVLVALVEVQQVHRPPRSLPVGRRRLALGRRRAGRDPARGGGKGLSAHRDRPARSATAARPG